MAFVLAHLSDAHIGPIPRPNLAELLGKRVTGYVNWLHKRAAQHDMDVLGRLVADMRAQQPDHVAMTGDIVNIGLAGEFSLARKWLATLGAAQDVSFTPGNHDAYVDASMPEIERGFAPWMTDDAGAAGFPYVRRRGDLALIGLSSGVPTAPFVAGGRLGDEQRARLAAALEEALDAGLTRVVLLHHPPYRGGARLLRGLEDAASFEAIIARHGAELVLHGHNHRQMAHRLPTPQGEALVFGVASASARAGAHYPAAAYHLYTFEREGERMTITARARGLGADGRVVDLGPVAA